MESELPLLTRIHDRFHGTGTSSMDTSNSLIYGRPYGGLAILWTKSLSYTTKPVFFEGDVLWA
jgi:hypothetical protein